LLSTLSSCTKDDSPLCERNNFCKVVVENSTSIPLWVDCTEEGSNFNLEVRLMPGTSYTYTVTSGLLTVWAASDEAKELDSWNWDIITVGRCSVYTYVWHDKKSGRDDYNYFHGESGISKSIYSTKY